MANYTVEKIENGIATLRYADESWAEILLTETMTAEDLDDLAMDFAPKTCMCGKVISKTNCWH